MSRTARLPRGIRLRGTSFLVDVTVTGKGRKTATCHSLDEALAKQRELRAELRGEVPARGPSWTLQQALNATIKAAWSGTRGEHTAVANAGTAIEFFGAERRLDTIDTAALDEYVEYLEGEGLADGTINRKLAALSKMMTVAHARKGMLGKPAFPRRKEGMGRIRYLTPEEEAALLRLLGQWGMDDVVDAIVVLVDTGLRVGELFRLEVRDVDRNLRLLHIWENKADLPRSVPLTERAYQVIKRRLYAASYGVYGKGLRLFPYNHDWLRRPWDRAKVVMGLAEDKQFVPHALRHTCASRLVQRGVPIVVVQKWLGHKTLSVTMRYAHLAPTNLLEAVKVLEPLTLKVVEAA